MRLALLLLFLLTSSAQAKTIEVITEPGDKWTPGELDLIRRAAAVVEQWMGRTEIARCAYRNAWRGEPSEEDWGRYMGVFRRQKVLEIHIGKKPLAANYLAKARVGHGRIDGRHDRWTRLKIEFNDRRLKSKEDADPKTVDAWAATLAHELAHNMGLRHGSQTGDWEEDYAGYFVTELGYCIKSYGKHGSDGGDQKLRRERARRFKIDW